MDEREAEREGWRRACGVLRRQVVGLNRALRDAVARRRELEAIDRDPCGVAAHEQVVALQESVRELLREQAKLRREVGMRQAELADAYARVAGAPDVDALDVLIHVDQLLDGGGLVELMAIGGRLLAAAKRRRVRLETRTSKGG